MSLRIGYGWVVMGSLWISNLFVVCTGFTLGILLPDIRTEFGLNSTEAGLLGSIFFFGFAAFSLPSSILVSRYSPRLVILLALASSTVFLFVQGWASAFWVLLASRFIFVVLAVSRSAPEMLLIHQWFDSQRATKVLSLNFTFLCVGQTISLAAGPSLLALLGSWHNVYYLFAFGMLGSTILWYFVARDNPKTSTENNESTNLLAPMRVLMRRRALWWVATCQVGASIAFAAFMTFWPTFAIETYGFSLSKSGSLFSLYPIGGILGAFSAGFISERIRRRKPIIWSAGLILPIAYLLLLVTPNTIVLAIALLTAGVSAFIVIPIVMTIPFDMKLQPREIALAIGLIRTFTPLAAAIGPIFVGVIYQLSGSLLIGLLTVVPLPFFMAICGFIIPETSPLRNKQVTVNANTN
jgi:predicted MFS family arabinose efflux permease